MKRARRPEGRPARCPLRRLEFRPALRQPGCPGPPLPLMQVHCPAECCYATGLRDHWFPAPAKTSAFRPRPTVSLRPPSTAALRPRFHPPASFAPAPESCASQPAHRAAKPDERLPWGFRPSSRHQPAASTPDRNPTPGLTFRPRRFSRPRRFAPPPTLRVCFTPQPRPGFALQGFVPLRGAVPGFPGRVMPSCRWTNPPAV